MNLRTSGWRAAIAAIFGFMLTVTLYACHTTGDLSNDASPRAGGVISFISPGGDGAEVCHLPVHDMDLVAPNVGCGMQNLRYVNFKSVPSATTIRFKGFEGGYTCDRTDYAFNIEFKTRGEYTSDPDQPWDLQALLADASPGAIMDRNFMVSDLFRSPGTTPSYNYLIKLSCIQIRDGHGVTNIKLQGGNNSLTNAPAAPTSHPGALAEYGSLVLTDINDEVCTHPITGADIRKWSEGTNIPGCSENFKIIRSIQLRDVPSAVTIYLRSFGFIAQPGASHPVPPKNDCDAQYDGDHAFRIDMKTTGSIGGISKKFDIDDIISTTPKNAIVPNLRLLSYSRALNSFNYPTAYYFSCFKFDLGGA